MERERGFATAHEEDDLAHAGTDRVGGDQRPPGRLLVGTERLQDQELKGRQLRVFATCMLVPWNRDGLHKSRSAAPGWQGATTEDIAYI
jgi:hypothetical protein